MDHVGELVKQPTTNVLRAVQHRVAPVHFQLLQADAGHLAREGVGVGMGHARHYEFSLEGLERSRDHTPHRRAWDI
jgi:hypothetical protein